MQRNVILQDRNVCYVKESNALTPLLKRDHKVTPGHFYVFCRRGAGHCVRRRGRDRRHSISGRSHLRGPGGGEGGYRSSSRGGGPVLVSDLPPGRRFLFGRRELIDSSEYCPRGSQTRGIVSAELRNESLCLSAGCLYDVCFSSE